MLRIGITGGIGSGKSTATAMFAELGVPVIDADVISRALTQPDQPAFKQISEHFKQPILKENGHLDRALLKNIIFNNPEDKDWLEQLLHPLVIDEITKQQNECKGPYCLISAPLLMEAKGAAELVDRMLVIDTDENLQIERTIQRDELTEEAVKNIMASQLSREERLKRTDDVIENNSSLKTLKRSIVGIHEKYFAMAHN